MLKPDFVEVVGIIIIVGMYEISLGFWNIQAKMYVVDTIIASIDLRTTRSVNYVYEW